MNSASLDTLWKMIGLRYQSHPWHGVPIGPEAPQVVTAFIEVVPGDTVKYEVDKPSGHLKVDRPQKFSNHVPALYGFIPQTYCKEEVGKYCMERTGKTNIIGDNDPLDICVLTEHDITHGSILVQATPIGGFRLVDSGEADDKIIAVLAKDEVYSQWQDISQLPANVVRRLQHYFLTYKQLPGEPHKCEITHIYGKEEAYEVIRRSQTDYQHHYGDLENRLTAALLDAIKNG